MGLDSEVFEEVNNYGRTLLRNSNIMVSILNDYIESHDFICFVPIKTKDGALNKLVQHSMELYNDNELLLATEKVWDAFERLKTYYSPPKDKSDSANTIIDNMSGSEQALKEMYNNEFNVLTKIGNNFRIRHHETTKIDITDDRLYDYFYKRCFNLISNAALYLE